MADPIPPVENDINRQITEIDGGAIDPMMGQVAPVPERLYKMDPASKIPVSKVEGKVWESKVKAGKRRVDQLKEMWEEAERYYNNVQASHRKNTGGDRAGNAGSSKDRRELFSITENMVYATVNAVIPAIYAKNPDCEVTMFDEKMQRLGDMLETLGDRLASMKMAPGIALKSKVRKSIVRCEISNEAWILVGYTQKSYSADQAREDIRKISEELIKAEDEKKILELEGQLMALEEQVDLLDPAGPFVKAIRGVDVVVDADSVEDDFSDANFMGVSLMFATSYLNAKYRTKNDKGEYISAYKPTHVVDVQMNDGQTTQEEIDSFKMLKDTDKNQHSSYGYADQQSFDRAKRTKCWYIFDKVKRRFYLYADNDWTWPIWVMDDPYQLPNFYPLHRLQFHTDPVNNRTKGEVSNYLDQQDAINTIQDELNRMRRVVRDKVLYNSSKIDAATVEDLINNPNKKAVGVALGEDGDINKLLMPPPTPTLQFQHLWDPSQLKQAINVISGVGDAMRGEQFKTNTTNKAIESYSSINNERLDEKRDAVEDFVGNIMYDIIFMCCRFMDQDTVAGIVGSQYQDVVSNWQNLDAPQIRKLFKATVAGGSTQKPTSAAKKAEAMQVAQILGQFASATPYAIIIALRVFERAFDGVAMTQSMWNELLQSIQMQMQRGNSQGGPASEGDPAESSETGEQEALTPEQAQQAIQKAVQQGVPEEVARQKIMARVKH